jgi:hypothetical protein
VKHRTPWIASLCGLALLLAHADPSAADIGFGHFSRHEAAPGESVSVSIGCGFCIPRCVGKPGQRHPPGRRDGSCILGGPARRPTGFPVWLTPLDHELGPYPGPCERSAKRCPPGSRPPHLPSFTYLGRAGRASSVEGVEVPRYALRFRLPEVEPGRYKYVLYCGSCYRGPGGVVIDSAVFSDGGLGAGVLTVRSGESGRSKALMGAGIAAAIALPGIGLWIRRRSRG